MAMDGLVEVELGYCAERSRPWGRRASSITAQTCPEGSPGWKTQIPQIALKEVPADRPTSMLRRIADVRVETATACREAKRDL